MTVQNKTHCDSRVLALIAYKEHFINYHIICKAKYSHCIQYNLQQTHYNALFY